MHNQGVNKWKTPIKYPNAIDFRMNPKHTLKLFSKRKVPWMYVLRLALLPCVAASASCTPFFVQRCDIEALFPESPLVIVDNTTKDRLTLGCSIGINTGSLLSKDTTDLGSFAKIDTTNHDPYTFYQGLNYLDSINTSYNNVLWRLPRGTMSLSAAMELFGMASLLANLQLGYLNSLKYNAGLGFSLHHDFGPLSLQANDMVGAYNSSYHAKYVADISSYDMGYTHIAFAGYSERGRSLNLANQANLSINSNGLPYANYLLNVGYLSMRYLRVYSSSGSHSRSFLKFTPAVYTSAWLYRLILSMDLIIDEMNFDLPPFLRAGVTLQRMVSLNWPWF